LQELDALTETVEMLEVEGLRRRWV
jgi:hypothetical protein